MKPRIVDRRGYLASIGWSTEAARQPEEEEGSFHAATGQVLICWSSSCPDPRKH